MRVTIRRAEQKDFDAVIFLIREFSHFQKCPEKVTITKEQVTLEQDYFKCLIAENEVREVVGFATFFFAYYSWSGKAIYLDDLYVTNLARNQGIGKRLLNEVIFIARDEGCKKVRWQVSRWNEQAIAFYKKMGAKTNDVEINCDFKL